MALPPVIVTNFKRRITGVTSTALNVTARQRALAAYQLGLCGPTAEFSLSQVLRQGFQRPQGQPFRIWHVRRNSEMAWGLFAKRVLRQPIRLVFTSAAIRRHSAYPRWLIGQMDAVVATSDIAASLLGRVDCIQGHGVDTDKFYPGVKAARPQILCIGRIRPEKGTDILVDALCQVLPRHPDAQATFIGRAKGRDAAFLAAQQAKLAAAGLDRQVRWLGELPAEQTAKMLASAHILAATPRYEGFGLTAFEGLAAGCAVLVSQTGALPLAAMGGRTGRVVPLADVEATALALADLLSDTKRLGHMQIAARQAACTDFNLDQEAKTLLDLYERLWAKSSKPRVLNQGL